MSNTFNDNHTQWLNAKMTEYEEKIYEMEDDMSSFDDNEEAIISYLNDIHFSMTLGLALRRYLCTKYAVYDEINNMFIFEFGDKKIIVRNYQSEDYDILTDELSEYSDIFIRIDNLFNSSDGEASPTGFTKAEAKRMLKITASCTREKMFLISFALHMNSVEMHKFLTDVLAEQTYNFRNPNEVIAFFCQTHDIYNSYKEYERIKIKYTDLSKGISNEIQPKANYTQFASNALKDQIDTIDELMQFLLTNQNNFNKFTQTTYNEYIKMYFKALDKTKIQMLTNDEYITFTRMSTEEQTKAITDRINRARCLVKVSNNEQLAKEMLSFVPRYTKEYERKVNKKESNSELKREEYIHVIENDFINIYNGERGQKGKKTQTTTLPKEITKNLSMRDRLDALYSQKKPVQRKDLVFMKFYLLSLDMSDKEEFTTNDYWKFIDECNDMLMRCGFSRLYPGNRFENLILLSLLSSNPSEMFENILEYSFFNEPEAPNED